MKKLLPLLISLFFVSTVFAQETPTTPIIPPPPVTAPPPSSITITAIPPRLEIEALPGATIQETIKIQNNSDREMAFSVSATDFIVNDNKGTPLAVDETVSGRWSLAAWVTASPKKVLLSPSETTAIDLVVSVPQDALPGGHYAMITYTPITEGTLNQPAAGIGGGSAILQKVGTLIYFNVIGDVVEAANLKEFKVDSFFANYGPINLNAEIENLGDVHFAPQGQVTITNLLGKTIFNENLEEKNIFPFTSRTYSWQVPGKYFFGRYMAKLEATAGATQLPINGLIYFWIIPVKEVAMALGVIIIILILIIITVKRRRKPTPTPPLEPTLEPELK